MEPVHFYWVGGALTLAAIVVSIVGLRDDGFPSSRGALLGTLALFLFGVVATTAYAVVNARDEQDHRRAELAEAKEAGAEELEAQETGAEGSDIATPADEEEAPEGGGQDGPGGGETDAGGAAGPGPVSMVEYSFEPAELTVERGATVEVDNDGEIIHNLTVVDGSEELGGSGNVESDESGDLEVEFPQGEYEMVCTIPGHEELGMTGTFTVE